MKTERAFPILLVSIVILVGIIAWQFRTKDAAASAKRHPEPRVSASGVGSPGSGQSADRSITRPPGSFVSTGLEKPEPVAPVAPVEAEVTGPLSWRNVEAADYPTYVGNLRRIGVPEQTIRDVVTADVKQTYAARRRDAVDDAYEDFVFWEAGTDRVKTLETDRRSLDGEMNSVLEQLLGDETIAPDTALEWRGAVLDRQLEFLPEQKRDVVRDLLLKQRDTDSRVIALVDNDRPTQDPAELRQIIENNDLGNALLRQTLLPEDYTQLKMTVSWTADNLRRRLKGFNPTESEYRLIFEEWHAQDQMLARMHALGPPDPGNLGDAVQVHIRDALGERRYQEYLRAWNR